MGRPPGLTKLRGKSRFNLLQSFVSSFGLLCLVAQVSAAYSSADNVGRTSPALHCVFLLRSRYESQRHIERQAWIIFKEVGTWKGPCACRDANCLQWAVKSTLPKTFPCAHQTGSIGVSSGTLNHAHAGYTGKRKPKKHVKRRARSFLPAIRHLLSFATCESECRCPRRRTP